MGLLTDARARWAKRRAATDRARILHEIIADHEDIWRRLCAAVGLSTSVDTASGVTVVTPRLVNADISGPNLVLVVKLLPGQLPADFEAVAAQIAPALGVPRVRITPRDLHWIRIELLQRDPLDVRVTTPRIGRSLSVADHPVLVAQTEDGVSISMSWISAPHAVVQGATRSGKSVWCYSTLAQLADFDDVVIAGSDPSGLLLGRPFVNSRHTSWQVTGSRDVLAHLALLRLLVDEMDERIATLPPRVDKLDEFTIDCPLVVVVLEEFAGLLRLASTASAPKGEAKVRDQLLGLYGRLVSEGHKAGFRLLVVTQRADATVVGGFERGQLGLKISFRVDDDEALPMLHGSGSRALVSEHRYAAPGIALLDSPLHRLGRVRGPRLPGDEATDYARYWDEIATAAARLHVVAA